MQYHMRNSKVTMDRQTLAPGRAQNHFHTDAPTGRRCDSAFALLSHKKVTKRLPNWYSYGKIIAVRKMKVLKEAVMIGEV